MAIKKLIILPLFLLISTQVSAELVTIEYTATINYISDTNGIYPEV